MSRHSSRIQHPSPRLGCGAVFAMAILVGRGLDIACDVFPAMSRSCRTERPGGVSGDAQLRSSRPRAVVLSHKYMGAIATIHWLHAMPAAMVLAILLLVIVTPLGTAMVV